MPGTPLTKTTQTEIMVVVEWARQDIFEKEVVKPRSIPRDFQKERDTAINAVIDHLKTLKGK